MEEYRMTMVEDMAAFAVGTTFEDLSERAARQVKLLVMDTIGCAIGSLGGEPIRYLRAQADDFGGAGHCTLIGGGKTAPDRAAFYNAALVRYLDFNDGYMGRLATSHPSDNMGPVLAASEYAGNSGKEFMTALALAYQVQCRLCDEMNYEKKGFDQPMAGAYAVAAGASRALGLDAGHAANAIALSGVSSNPLFVTRTGTISHWKGFAYAGGAFNAIHATFMAMRGVTGPLSVIEGPLGVTDSITGPINIDWSKENLEKVLGISIKKYNSGVHAQTAIEGVIEMKAEHGFAAGDIERIDITTYERAHFIMGGGQGGDRQVVPNKETADHSMPYVLAVALLDGNVMPAQYENERIQKEDVQALLRRVFCSSTDEMTARYPAQSPCHFKITLKNGTVHTKDKPDFEGFFAHPISWDTVVEKFGALTEQHTDAALRGEIADAVSRLESIQARELAELLGRVKEAA
jgi:2-methylcitrate dehydratase